MNHVHWAMVSSTHQQQNIFLNFIAIHFLHSQNIIFLWNYTLEEHVNKFDICKVVCLFAHVCVPSPRIRPSLDTADFLATAFNNHPNTIEET